MFKTFIVLLIYIVFSGSSFALAAERLHEKKYWMFGFNLILAICMTAMTVKMLLM